MAGSVAFIEEAEADTLVEGISVPLFPAVFGASDVGLARKRNEDAFAVLDHLGLFMVADGMGGTAGGELASRTVVDEVRRAVEDGETTWPLDTSIRGPESSPRRLLAGIQRANRDLHRQASADPRKQGMGTTFAGLLRLQRCAVIAHVGDSRVYRLRDGALERLTYDHSLVNDLLARGVIEPHEVKSHPKRNIITRAVGPHEAVVVDTKIVDIRPGDVFLLCTDGLHGALDDGEIAAILDERPDPTAAVERLIARSKEEGGFDNITAVVLRIGAG